MGNATNNSGFGFRVLKTHPHSPAHEAGIIPFLDFIVNIELSQSELKEANLSNIQSFFNTIQANENKEIHVTLFNIYDRQLRKIKMVPHKNWPEADSLLGVLLRYEEYMTALERTYKVIQVVPGSEAEKLGFVEEYDYVVGLTTYQYKDLGEFIRLLFKAEEVCVFNVKESKLKFILMPKEKCVLGCQFGEGILNQLPYKRYELPLIEEVQHHKQHEDIVDLTEETSHSESQIQNLNPAVSPVKVIEAPPKKNEIHPEHKSGIGLDDHAEKKNYQEMLKATSSKSTLEYIHHKRSEHLKKNGPPAGRFLPKNPFQSPTFKNGNEGEKKENAENLGLGESQKENLKEQQMKENPKENMKEESKPLKESKEPPKEILKDSRENSKEIQENKVDLPLKEKENRKENDNIQNNGENLKIDENLKQEKKIEGNELNEESVENARFAKMVMKYSYYCPKLKDEYVINSSDLMQMTVKIE